MQNTLRSDLKMKAIGLAVIAVLATSGTVLIAQNPGPGQTQTKGGQRTDGQIETDVVQALDGSAALKNDLITAATIEGQVTLSGTVASDADRQLAESIVAKVAGVTKVNNHLRVGNPADDPNAQGAPDDNTMPPMADGQGSANPPTYTPPPGNTQQQPGVGQQQGGQQPGYGQQPPQAPSRPVYGQDQPPYGQQPGYPPPPPGYGQPAYGYPPPGYRQPYPPQGPQYAIARGQITVLDGTVLQVRTVDSISDKNVQPNQPLDFTVIRDVLVNGYLAIPRGAMVHGVITEVKHAGQLTGTPELALAATELDIDGHKYPLESDLFKVKGPSKTGHTVGNAVGGALLGALIGGAAGGGGGAAIGAVAGGATGTAVSAIGTTHAWIPAEALVTFHLNAPVTVDPVSRDVAARLAQGLYPGGPQLYQRRGYGMPGAYPAPYPYAGYPAYPPVYYRPYYAVNGYYYWR